MRFDRRHHDAAGTETIDPEVPDGALPTKARCRHARQRGRSEQPVVRQRDAVVRVIDRDRTVRPGALRIGREVLFDQEVLEAVHLQDPRAHHG